MDESAEKVFDWAARFSDRVHAVAKLRDLRASVHRTQSTCGSCAIWMTNSCPRERHDNRTGRKHGPSCAEINCASFVMSAVAASGVAKDEAEIAAIKERL